MTDIARDPELEHLTGAVTRLTAVLARPRFVAVACIAVLTGAGWLALALMAAEASPLWLALCRPGATGGWAGALPAIPMWSAMVLSMMLPTAGPMVLTYAEIADTAARKGETAVSPLVLMSGYLLVWLGFALAAAVLQQVLAGFGLLTGDAAGALVAGTIFAAAGLYQFSALKRACLTLCQRPFPYFFSNWTAEPAGVFWLGLRQGLHCVGCCWAMMMVMFAVGAMNVVWMAALGILMTLEKMTSTPRFSEAVGAAFLLAGVVMMVSSVG